MPSIGELAVQIGLDEARRGVFEANNDNRGVRVDDYARAANGVFGEAWCVKFVFWCYAQAAARLGVKNPLPRIFGAHQLEIWAARENKAVKAPVAGDVLIKEHKHAGLVSGSPLANGTFPSVEGNTWANTDFAHRREGVYALKNEQVAKCTFIHIT
jgi:hypothetical protein